MRYPYVPPRYEYCTLSKYHTCEHYYERDTWGLAECEPRCLDRIEVMKDDFIFEPSFVRRVYVPIERRDPSP